MSFSKIELKIDGYVYCRSSFYTAQDTVTNHFLFSKGINKMIGEIDSGIWAASYTLSMYRYRKNDFILNKAPQVIADNQVVIIDDVLDFSCYLDEIDPLFSGRTTVENKIKQGLERIDTNYSPNDIRDIFEIDKGRFKRPLKAVGHEVFKAMAAIGYSYNKQIFCFPWLSYMRFDNYHRNLTDLMQMLERLNKIVIVPIGFDNSKVLKNGRLRDDAMS